MWALYWEMLVFSLSLIDTRTTAKKVWPLIKRTSANLRYQLQRWHFHQRSCTDTVTHNKIQFIDLIIQKIKEQLKQLCMCQHKLVVTGHDYVPTEVNHGLADSSQGYWNITAGSRCNYSSTNGYNCCSRELSIHVVADETELLLLHYYQQKKLNYPVTMASTCKDRKYIDIQATVTSYRAVIPHLQAAYALTGCDTTANTGELVKPKLLNCWNLVTSCQIWDIH